MARASAKPKPPPGGYGTGMCPDWLGQHPCWDRAVCHDHGCQDDEPGDTAFKYVQEVCRLKFQVPARVRALRFQAQPFHLPHGTWLPCAAKDRALASGGYVVDGVRVPLCKHHLHMEGLEAVMAARETRQGK